MADFDGFVNSQFLRRKNSYKIQAIFTPHDLAGEIFVDDAFSGYKNNIEECTKIAEKIARRGSRKIKRYGGFEEIPISQLPKEQRRAMENIFYSYGSFEDE